MKKYILLIPFIFILSACPTQITEQKVDVSVNVGDEIKDIIKGVKSTPTPSPTPTVEPEEEPTKLTGAGYSLKLKGVNSYASASSSDSFNLKNVFTLQAWIKINSFHKSSEGDYFPILFKGSKDVRYGVSIKSPSIIEVKMNNQKVLIKDSADFLTRTWYYLSVVWDGKYIYVYRNGNLSGQSEYNVASLISGENANFYIGADLSAVEKYADGEIDELRIWNKSLTEKDIKSNMHFKLKGNEEGLNVYFPFDEGRDETATDLSINKNKASIINMDKWRISNAPIYD